MHGSICICPLFEKEAKCNSKMVYLCRKRSEMSILKCLLIICSIWFVFCSLDQQPDPENELLNTIEKEKYDEVQGKLTAKALMNYSHNPLLLAIKVSVAVLLNRIVFVGLCIVCRKQTTFSITGFWPYLHNGGNHKLPFGYITIFSRFHFIIDPTKIFLEVLGMTSVEE